MPRLRTTLLALALAGAGCQGRWTTERLCEDLSVRLCDGLTACDCRFDVRPYDENTCVAERSARCVENLAGFDEADLDRKAIPDCLADVEAMAADCRLDPGDSVLPPSCDAALGGPVEDDVDPDPGGPVAEGQACTGPDQCAAGLACGRAPETRVCAEPDGLGAACEDGTCAEGLACGITSRVCEALPGEGQTCLDGVGCGAGLTCAFDTTTCVVPPGEGEACLSIADLRCAEGLGCRESDQTCQSPSVAVADAPCLTNGAAYLCADGLGCDFAANGSFCVPVGGAGDPCTNDTVCGPGTYCEFSTLLCTADLPDGEPCEDGNECADGSTCALGPDGWRCAPIPGAAEPCLDACADGLACKGPGGECVPEICVVP